MVSVDLLPRGQRGFGSSPVYFHATLEGGGEYSSPKPVGRSVQLGFVSIEWSRLPPHRRAFDTPSPAGQGSQRSDDRGSTR